MIAEVLTVQWQPSGGADIVGLEAQEEGLLYGELPARSSASVQAAILSPDGSYAITANYIRGTSGTQRGHGILESWNLYVSDIQSSEWPEAATMPILGRKHVLKLAYSSDSTRVAALDQTGVVNIFRVRVGEQPELATSYRSC